jgi:hypothetical protein
MLVTVALGDALVREAMDTNSTGLAAPVPIVWDQLHVGEPAVNAPAVASNAMGSGVAHAVVDAEWLGEELSVWRVPGKDVIDVDDSARMPVVMLS